MVWFRPNRFSHSRRSASENHKSGKSCHILRAGGHSDFCVCAIAIYWLSVPTANSVTNVEFFANAIDLGSGVNLSATNRPILLYKATPSLSLLSSLYCFVWTNAPVGSYALTAVATASSGLSRTSAPVNITILATATNTNPTDIVSIDAIDPIAIAGTNAYVWRGVTNATPTWTNWSGAAFQWFTNWGPKNAIFAVKRFGDASSDLTVNYSIGGTASNGVDYAALPGFVTVPAGSAYALIPIVPIDNGSSNVSKTVVLTLTPSTNTPTGLHCWFSATRRRAHLGKLAASAFCCFARRQFSCDCDGAGRRMVLRPVFKRPCELVVRQHQSSVSRLN